MINVKNIKAIVDCEKKSYEQAILFLLRTEKKLTQLELQKELKISNLELIKTSEGGRRIYKKLSPKILKKFLDFYGLTHEEFVKYQNLAAKLDLTYQEYISCFEEIYNFSYLKSFIYVFSHINDFTKKDYQKIIRLSRVQVNRSSFDKTLSLLNNIKNA